MGCFCLWTARLRARRWYGRIGFLDGRQAAKSSLRPRSGCNLPLPIRRRRLPTLPALRAASSGDSRELRLLGNDAAHIESKAYDKVEREKVEVGIEFAKEVLIGVSDLLARLRGLQAQHEDGVVATRTPGAARQPRSNCV